MIGETQGEIEVMTRSQAAYSMTQYSSQVIDPFCLHGTEFCKIEKQ